MRHLVISDTQVKPGGLTAHLGWAGKYMVDMRPDVVVMIGDWWDMPSLCYYDKGKKSFENRRYWDDIEAGNAAMDVFMAPLRKLQKRQRKQKKQLYNPRLVFCLGNHEKRIETAVENDAILEDVITYNHFNLSQHGWEVHDFLDVVVVDGVAYSHYFTSGIMGRPVSSARAMLNKKHMSTVMGHVQDRDIAFSKRADGTAMTGIFTGIFYEHDELYLNPQTNQSWRGIWVLNDVNDGSFDELPVSLNYLRKKYHVHKDA